MPAEALCQEFEPTSLHSIVADEGEGMDAVNQHRTACKANPCPLWVKSSPVSEASSVAGESNVETRRVLLHDII